MPRIVLSTVGSLGDLHPFLALGRELKSRGHSVVLATHGIYREDAERAGLEFHAMRPDVSDWGDVDEARRRAIDERTGSEYVVRTLVLPYVRATYADLLSACAGADVIVSHMLVFAAPLIAEQLRVPRVHIVLQPTAMLSSHDPMPPPGLVSAPKLPVVAWDVLWRMARMATRPWFREVEALRGEIGLPRTTAHPFFDSRSSHLNLALFSKEFAPPQPDWPEPMVQTGFPFGDGDGALPDALRAFLDTGPAPIVFTLGSTGVWDPGSFYHEAARASEILGKRAVLLVGPKNPLREPTSGAPQARGTQLVALSLPPGVIACEYAPHRELFPRAAVNVHHGGIGTTGEALRSGRPMLVVPFGHDQPDNARRCRDLGVARVLRRSRVRAERLARELRAVLDDTSMAERAREVGERVRGESGVRAAADAIGALLD